jgi:ABC-2 type transport system permease protein
MWRYLRLIGVFIRVSIQNDAAYRANFVVQALVSLLHFGAELVGLWTIYSNTRSLAGWGPYELMALLGVFQMMVGVIATVIAPNMRQVMEEIREGELDYVMIRPVNSQFYVSVRNMVLWRLSDVVLGAVLVVFAMVKLSASFSPLTLLIFATMLAAGVVIIYSFWLVLATLAFWLTRVNNMEMVFWNVFEAGRYPVNIYPPQVRWALTFLVPLAFLTTYPAGALVGRMPMAGVAEAVLAAALSLAAASLFWRFGLSRYSGASA